jgi:hypothetical protein
LSLDGVGERILIFGSQWNITFLSYCTRWHADGTFLTRPLLFAQIYIIFGYLDGFLIPCFYCLTSKQNQLVYEKIYNHILLIGSSYLNIKYSPETLTCDFEIGSINAATELFPNISIDACFFHYTQNLWRRIQDLKLNKLVTRSNKKNNFSNEEKEKASKWFSAAVGLALIPPALVESVWTDVMGNYTPESPAAQEFNDYMVDNYVCQQSARFCIELWNVHDNIRNKLPRTNNAVEAYNFCMSTVFPPHPHI